MIPEDAIHPEVTYRRWVDSFEHHLGQIPDVLSMLVTLGQPSIGVSRGGSQFDRLQVTGGNDHRDLSDVIDTAVTRDAGYLWGLLGGYAATVWDRAEATRADAPALTADTLASPGTARDVALVTVGWLITHATTIHTLTELEEGREELFRTIRRLKAVHGIHPHPRRGPRKVCKRCGDRAVVLDWVDSPRAGEGEIRVGKCKTCGSTSTGW